MPEFHIMAELHLDLPNVHAAEAAVAKALAPLVPDDGSEVWVRAEEVRPECNCRRDVGSRHDANCARKEYDQRKRAEREAERRRNAEVRI